MYQSGFRKNHSTDFCLSFINVKILNGFDQGLMILIDLQKPFDTIGHDSLLQKLYAAGLSKHSVNCFRSDLINRTFLVNLGNTFSQPACVSCNLHVCPATCKDLLLILYSFSCILMICHKLSNVIFFFMLMIHVVSVNINILIKLKNN